MNSVGERIFVVLHISLLMGVIWGAFVAKPVIQRRVQVGLSVFLVVHFALHAVLEEPGISSFEGLASNVYSVGSAVFGALCVGLARRSLGCECGLAADRGLPR